MACPGCIAPNDLTDRYCTNCGSDLTSQHIVCPNSDCGYSYFAAQVKFTYCPKCGAKMPESSPG
jgi:predicted amidophosphoribosyltransferase